MTGDDVRPQRRHRLPLGLAAALAAPVPREALARTGRVRFRGEALPWRGACGPGLMGQGRLEHRATPEHDANSGADAIEAEEAASGARRTGPERQEREVAGRAARDGEAAVKRRNRPVGRRRSAANDVDARPPALDAPAGRHGARVAEFNAGCAGSRHRRADMRAVRARLLLD